MRILVTTVGLAGHFFPLVPLCWAFRSVGHDVLIACPEEFVPVALGSGLPVTSSGPGWTGDRAGDPTFGRPEQRSVHGRVFGRMAAIGLPAIREVTRSWRPDLVVSERAEFAGPLAAYEAGVPQVELHWGMSALPEYRWGAQFELREALTELGLDDLPEPESAINPWPPGLRQPYAAPHRGIRHVPYNSEARVAGWMLGRQRPRICVTQGTVIPTAGNIRFADDIVAILRELACLAVDVVVAVDERVAAEWPELPANVRHVGRVPLAPVLAFCDLAVHHGGHGTSLTALAAGLPQLVLPVFDDQFDNAGAVVAAGAGMSLLSDDVDPRSVAEHCAVLLDRPRFRTAAQESAAEIATQPSPTDVALALADPGTDAGRAAA